MAEVRFETDAQLDKMLLSDKKMEAKVRNITRKVLNAARNAMRGRMSHISKRDAYLAIRKSVYTKVIGGNINIATPTKGAVKRVPPRPSSRGRTQRTEQIMSYWGSSRGFLLRFWNSGTEDRVATHMNGHRILRTQKVPWHNYKSGEIGGRGRIQARNWFGSMSQQELERTAQMFDELMAKIIDEEFNKK